LVGWIISRELPRGPAGWIAPRGATSAVDAFVGGALPRPAPTQKALVIISDGNDTSSHTTVPSETVDS
jgi:hypothetical protein